MSKKKEEKSTILAQNRLVCKLKPPRKHLKRYIPYIGLGSCLFHKELHYNGLMTDWG